jgi:hypothetical protein
MDVPSMMFWRWFVGLGFSIVIGHFAVDYGLRMLRRWLTGHETLAEHLTPEERGVPASLVGVIERLFFTVVVAYDVSGSVTAMVAWCAVKMATNWDTKDAKMWLPFPGTSLLGSFASMLFALAGGLIIRAPSLG